MIPRRPGPMTLWAVRDLLRYPAESILLGLCLAALVALPGTAMLLSRGLAETSAQLLAAGPDLVIRRVGGAGFLPLPEADGIAAARSVPGVIGVRSRIWGTAAGPDGPVTVVTRSPDAPEAPEIVPDPPKPGAAVVGPGISVPDAGTIPLTGVDPVTVRVAGRFPESLSMAAHDLVWLHPADARRLLGIPADSVSDLAVEVFHEAEADAIQPDLAAAFPWPVRITPRQSVVGRYRADLARRGGLVTVSFMPAVLGLSLLVLTTVRSAWGRRREIALLRALGWTAGDVVRLTLRRALAVGLPATALGMGAAYTLVFWPGIRWPGALLLGWSGPPPALRLDPAGAPLTLLTLAALVLIPYLAAAVLPALRAASGEVADSVAGAELP